MASFGESLKQARKARNISLQEIAESTKIGTRTLQALEDERFELLPGGIFNKGFVRSYARSVGMDEEKAVAAYMAAANVQPPETDLQTLSSQVLAARQKQSEPWWSISAVTVVGIVALLIALGVGGFLLNEHRKEAKEQAKQQAAVEQLQQAPAVSQAPLTSIPADTTTAASDQNAAQTQQSTTLQNASQANTSPAMPPSAGLNAGSQAAPVEVSISATARSWISVRSDGKTVESLTMDPENPDLSTRSYKAKEQLKLIVGNPAGVTVTYNGRPEGALGAEGHRATVTFTPQGMEKQ